MSVFAIGVRPPLRLLVAFLRAIALVSPLLLPPAASAVDLWAAHAPVCDACSFPAEAYKYLDANTACVAESPPIQEDACSQLQKRRRSPDPKRMRCRHRVLVRVLSGRFQRSHIANGLCREADKQTCSNLSVGHNPARRALRSRHGQGQGAVQGLRARCRHQSGQRRQRQ